MLVAEMGITERNVPKHRREIRAVVANASLSVGCILLGAWTLLLSSAILPSKEIIFRVAAPEAK